MVVGLILDEFWFWIDFGWFRMDLGWIFGSMFDGFWMVFGWFSWMDFG